MHHQPSFNIITLSNQKQLAWGSNKVYDYLVKGINQYEIAEMLKVSQSTVNKDVQFLRNRARENMKTHLHNKLPE